MTPPPRPVEPPAVPAVTPRPVEPPAVPAVTPGPDDAPSLSKPGREDEPPDATRQAAPETTVTAVAPRRPSVPPETAPGHPATRVAAAGTPRPVPPGAPPAPWPPDAGGPRDHPVPPAVPSSPAPVPRLTPGVRWSAARRTVFLIGAALVACGFAFGLIPVRAHGVDCGSPWRPERTGVREALVDALDGDFGDDDSWGDEGSWDDEAFADLMNLGLDCGAARHTREGPSSLAIGAGGLLMAGAALAAPATGRRDGES